MPAPVAALTAAQHAHLLHEAYLEDRRLGDTGPDPITRQELVDYLGCHLERREQAWEEWLVLMQFEVVDLLDAAFWYDVEFVEPRPEDLDVA